MHDFPSMTVVLQIVCQKDKGFSAGSGQLLATAIEMEDRSLGTFSSRPEKHTSIQNVPAKSASLGLSF